jgi:hypothetical protein
MTEFSCNGFHSNWFARRKKSLPRVSLIDTNEAELDMCTITASKMPAYRSCGVPAYSKAPMAAEVKQQKH